MPSSLVVGALALAVVHTASVEATTSADHSAVVPHQPALTEFFVCASHVDGMNGKYVLSDEFEMDDDAPVFVRADDDIDNSADGSTLLQDASVAVASNTPFTSDFRLFRRHGFWMFADFAQWPPTTHFRCDPTKSDVEAMDFLKECGVGLETPPHRGYTPVNADEKGADLLALQQSACGSDGDSTATAVAVDEVSASRGTLTSEEL